MDWYSSTLAQINKFVRDGIKQQVWALPEDENKEERLYIIEYVEKSLNTSLPEEAKGTQEKTLFTLFSLFSGSNSSFSDFFA